MQNDIRKRCHIAGRSGGSKILSNAFNKYGLENIVQTILHTVDSKEEAYELERAYRPYKEIGWNIAVGGGLPPNTSGRIDSIEVRNKRAKSVKLFWEGKERVSPFKGMTDRYTEEQRKTIGKAHQGKTISLEHRKAIKEKNSGSNNAKAKSIRLVHITNTSKVYTFSCIKDAAIAIEIPYNTIRSQAQRVIRSTESSEPSRTGWVCLTEEDSQNPVSTVNAIIAKRTARFHKMTAARLVNKEAKVQG